MTVSLFVFLMYVIKRGGKKKKERQKNTKFNSDSSVILECNLMLKISLLTGNTFGIKICELFQTFLFCLILARCEDTLMIF